MGQASARMLYPTSIKFRPNWVGKEPVLKCLLLSGTLIVASLTATAPAQGNIALTGHDDDYHCNAGDPNACTQLNELVSFAKQGSALPLLTFDAGNELTSDLTALGINYVNINPDTSGAVTSSLFNHSVYSAFVVASDYTCGGCDNDPTGEAAISAQSSAIDSFLNGGGGIVGLAGANSSGYYSFVPQAATSVGGAPSYGYSQTTVGAKYGVDAVNGDPTHNLFYNPGTNGESAFYQIVELNDQGNGTILPPAATTLICSDCTVSGGVIISPAPPTPTVTPEPSSFVLLGSGLVGAANLVRRRLNR